jgi:transcription initiation factor IIF auxiliary subunit
MSKLVEQLRVVDTPFDPEDPHKVIRYRQLRDQSAALYKVWIYLEGASLPFIEKVTYRLHPTFPDPERTVARSVSNPNCQIVIWAWGAFTLQAIVEDKQGSSMRLEHYLTFGDQIQSAQRDDSVHFEEARYDA